MASAYTSPIKDGISFEAFVMRCARAMGACVLMREEPMDAPIPERFEPSNYNANRLTDAEKKLAWLRQMPDSEAEIEAKQEYEVATKHNAECIQEAVNVRNKYQDMIANVVSWNPPTAEHEGLKNFMLQQLRDSLKFDADESYYLEHAPVLLSAAEWKEKRIADCLNEIDYHKKAYAEEVERTESRNRWIAELRQSLANRDRPMNTLNNNPIELAKTALEDSNELLRTITDEGVEQSLAQIHDNLNVIELLSAAQEEREPTYACEQCRQPACHMIRYTNVSQDQHPICDGCLHQHEQTAQEVNDHEMRNFGGAYGLVTWEIDPLPIAPPSSNQVWNEAVEVADKARLALSEKYQDRLKSGTSEMNGNMDWARLEGAVAVVNAIRSLKRPLQAQEPAKCSQCGSTSAISCNGMGCGYLESGNGEPEPSASGAVDSQPSPDEQKPCNACDPSVGVVCDEHAFQPSPDELPPLPDGREALFACEECSGTGKTGDWIPGTLMQPPEPIPCPSCSGSGHGYQATAYEADEVREYARTAIELSRAQAAQQAQAVNIYAITLEKLLHEKGLPRLTGEPIEAWAFRTITEYCMLSQSAAPVSAGWKPIDIAPRDNKRLLYLAKFDDAGKLQELDFDGIWEYWQESHELPHINGWDWASASGIEEPTHWAFQDEPLPTASPSEQPAAQTAGVPEGWKLVPVAPTEEMHVAAVKTIHRCTGNDDFPPRVYRAMLAAAPQPVAGQVDEQKPLGWVKSSELQHARNAGGSVNLWLKQYPDTDTPVYPQAAQANGGEDE